ncbi:PilW family protein [Massilia sp. DWR3-1-1]|uniref:PilW family protein n=1 Tax=Massilia sp. DWR3-1-1 TaxID=2804559 RepID=UPI003CEBBF8A
MKISPPPATRRAAAGFSLVELLVSVVIGLLALGFATRMVVSSETSKQAATGGADAMQNGVVALFSIERELAQAGWGLNDPLVAGCDTRFYDSGNYALLSAARGAGTVTPLASVVIESNTGASDRLSINAGSSYSSTGMALVANNYLATAGAIDIDRAPYGFNGTSTVIAGGDVIVVAPETFGSGRCSMAMVSQVVAPAAPGQNQLFIASGGNNRYNSGNLTIAYTSLQARLFNLGPAANLSFHTWSSSQGFLKLRATNLAGASAAPATVTDNIVALKAQYGLDQRAGAAFTPELGMQVSNWSGTMLDADGDGTAGSAGDYSRIAAVRIAVVARSRNPEKPSAATGLCTATTTAPTVFGGVAVTLAVTGDSVPWQCYRYRVFESMVPIRNSGWRPTAS